MESSFNLDAPRDRNSTFEPQIIKKSQTVLGEELDNKIIKKSSKNQKEFITDLKEVYKVGSKNLAESNLLSLDEKWGQKYPISLKSWHNN